MQFLINGTLEGQPFETEIEGEDREDAKVELAHSVICLDGKPVTKGLKFDMRTLRAAPGSKAEPAASSVQPDAA